MKRIAAVLAVIGLALGSVAYATPAQAASCVPSALGDICLSTDNGEISVQGPGGLSLTQPLPAPITLPPITVTVPGPVVTVPVPGPTVTRNIPGPTTTVTVTVPGPTSTITRTETVTPSPVTETRTETSTAPSLATPPGATRTVTRTVTVTPEAAEPEVETRIVTVSQAVGFSLLFVLLGALLVLLFMYLMYRFGKHEGERSVNAFLTDMLRVTYRRKH